MCVGSPRRMVARAPATNHTSGITLVGFLGVSHVTYVIDDVYGESVAISVPWGVVTRGRASRLIGAAVASALLALGCAPVASSAGPTPGPPGIPSQAQVDAARAAETAAAAQVAQLEAQYLAATARLTQVQTAVSAKAGAYAAAQLTLDERTQDAQVAQVTADRAEQAAAESAATLSRMAAAAYEQGSPTAQLTLSLVVSGPQQAVDLADYLQGQGSAQSAALREAAMARGVAAADRQIAADKREAQRQATAVAADALAELQEQLRTAQGQAGAIGADQAATAQQLAGLRQSTAQLQQERLDGLAAQAARRREAEQAAAHAAAKAQAAGQRQAQQQAARAAPQAGAAGAPAVGAAGAGAGTPAPAPAAVVTPAQRTPRAIAQQLMPGFGFGTDQWSCLDQLWVGESGWNWAATNPYSGAYGIPQALPATKMSSAGPDWLTNPATQISWGLSYIKSRYGTPCSAWAAWQARSPHWY